MFRSTDTAFPGRSDIRCCHSLDGGGQIPLQIHKSINVPVDLRLEVNDLGDGFLHGRRSVVGIPGHTGQCGSGLCCQIVECRHLLDLAVDALVKELGLG